MKFPVIALLIVFLASWSYASTEIWGQDAPDASLLYEETIIRSGLPEVSWDINVQFPVADTLNNKIITKIDVYDNAHNSYGAQPYLLAGGPGLTYASIELKGIVAKAVNTTIQVYGLDVYNYNRVMAEVESSISS